MKHRPHPPHPPGDASTGPAVTMRTGPPSCCARQSDRPFEHPADRVLAALARSSFRRQFRLSAAQAQDLHRLGRSAFLSQARRILAVRLAPARPANDGRQTPMRGHPLFIAQHATATCCRRCLAKWHGIRPGARLGEDQFRYVLAVLQRWIENQLAHHRRPEGPTGLFDDPADRW